MNPFSVSLENTKRGGDPPHTHRSHEQSTPSACLRRPGHPESHPPARSRPSPAPPAPVHSLPPGPQEKIRRQWHQRLHWRRLATAQESAGPHRAWGARPGCQPAPAAPASLEVNEARAHYSLQLQLKNVLKTKLYFILTTS